MKTGRQVKGSVKELLPEILHWIEVGVAVLAVVFVAIGTVKAIIDAICREKNSRTTIGASPLLRIRLISEESNVKIKSRRITEKPKIKGPKC